MSYAVCRCQILLYPQSDKQTLPLFKKLTILQNYNTRIVFYFDDLERTVTNVFNLSKA